MRARLIKDRLSDGSKVFAVEIVGDDGARTKIDCVDFKHADRLLEVVEDAAVSASTYHHREAA